MAVFVTAALACNISSSQDATAQAVRQFIAQTATAAGTAGPTPNAGLQTAEAEATEHSRIATATAATRAAEAASLRAATATVVAPILAELPSYGVDPSQGRPGWIHPPATVDVEGRLKLDVASEFSRTVARDFAIAADITGNTSSELSGCGFAVRWDGDPNNFSGYLIIASRRATRQVGFTMLAQGKPVGGQAFQTSPTDPNFQSQNDATNRLAVVGRGDTFTFFTNRVEIGSFVVPQENSYEKGFLALVGRSEVGQAHCEFNNTWVWLIN